MATLYLKMGLDTLFGDVQLTTRSSLRRSLKKCRVSMSQMVIIALRLLTIWERCAERRRWLKDKR
jgi:hypothetical protein